MKNFAELVRKVGDEKYPRIVELFQGGPSNTHMAFDIVFKRTIDADAHPANTNPSSAVAKGRTIFISSDYYSHEPNKLEFDFIHEMAHVALRYSGSVPVYWGEGMADYVCFKLGYTNEARCTGLCPHYTSGYTCAGAFLLYIDQVYGLSVILDLNQQFRRKTYDDSFFLKATGKPLELLWSKFQETAFFTEEAKDVLAYEGALGYVNRNPPADLESRVIPYLKARPAGKISLSAVSFCYRLWHLGKLPGVRKENENDKITITLDFWDWVNAGKPADYPASRTLHFRKAGDPSDYYYTLFREANDPVWHLKKACRTSKGQVVEEFQITE